MIEINLLPGSVKRAPRRGMPKFLGRGGGGGRPSPLAKLNLPPMDRTIAMVVGGWILALGVVALLHLSTSSSLADVNEELELANQEKARLAEAKARGDTMIARERIISQKLQVIQEIDGARFVYPHLFDEVSRTLPPYVWLVNLTEAVSEAGKPRVRLQGMAGNYFALGRFIEQLEGSPFVRAVRLISSNRVQEGQRFVFSFVLEFGYDDPPADVIQTVPLFAARQEGN